MARVVTFLFLFLFSCTTSKQLVEKNNESFNTLFFNTVTKDIKFSSFDENQINISGERLILDWFNEHIKTNGLDGSLNILVSNLENKVDRKEDYFKVTANISMQFNLVSNTLTSKKSFNLSASEFSEIFGKFSISDQENLSENTMKAALKKISMELNNLN